MIREILEVIDHAMALLKITKRKVVAKDLSDPLLPLELLDPLNLLVHQEREDPTSDHLDQRIKPVGEAMDALLHVEHRRTVSESRAMRHQRD